MIWNLFSDTFHSVSKLGGVVSVHHAENDEVVQVMTWFWPLIGLVNSHVTKC